MSTASESSNDQEVPLENGVLPVIQETLTGEEMGETAPDSGGEGEHSSHVMNQIERDLDSLTYSGSTINDLEMQLTRTKDLHRKTLIECRLHVDTLSRKLGSHIKKSEPFIEIWRKARQVQDASNKAAARYDKANNQYAAAKEMIRVAESQLGSGQLEQLEQLESEEQQTDPSSPSPIDQAWQEMLNHATLKVVATEKERRESEAEHLRIMAECTRIMELYRNTERKLRTHITKSKPYFQERYRANQRLLQIKLHIQALESKIEEAKRDYSATLKRLEALNTEIHQRRQSLAVTRSDANLAPRKVYSTGSSPELRRVAMNRAMGNGGGISDTESVDSLQIDGGVQFSGSTGSLPSIGTSSVSRSPTPDTRAGNSPSPEGYAPLISGHGENPLVSDPRGNPLICETSENPLDDKPREYPIVKDIRTDPPTPPTVDIDTLASELVKRSLSAAVSKLQGTTTTSSSDNTAAARL